MSPTTSQSTIDAQIAQQIGTNPLAALPSNPNITQALQNYVNAASNLSGVLNSNLLSIYETAFSNWANQVLAGKIPNTNPPQPPDGYEAAAASDGWTYVILGTTPVCTVPPPGYQMPSVPQPTTTMVIGIGSEIANTNYWAATPANANVPNGYTTPNPTTAADGTVGFFTFVATIGGGWWEKVG
jgi:hypothetical protein